jgi:hypothetical protein
MTALLAASKSGPVNADTYFTKDSNIDTNLNQQFPNTGPGVPGSGVGTPNPSFLYNPATFTAPSIVAGSDLASSNPTSFLLTSNSTGQDFMQLSTSQIAPPTPSLIVPINVQSATRVPHLSAGGSRAALVSPRPLLGSCHRAS